MKGIEKERNELIYKYQNLISLFTNPTNYSLCIYIYKALNLICIVCSDNRKSVWPFSKKMETVSNREEES